MSQAIAAILGLVGAFAGAWATLAAFEQSRQLEELRIATERVRQLAPDLDRRIQIQTILRTTLTDSTSSEEILQQKLRYDDGFLRWVENIFAHTKAAQQILLPNEYNAYSALLEQRLVGCMLRPADAAVTRLFRCRMNSGSSDAGSCKDIAAASLRSSNSACKIGKMSFQSLSAKVRDCGTSLSDYLQAVALQRQSALAIRWVLATTAHPTASEALRRSKDPKAVWEEAAAACSFGATDQIGVVSQSDEED